MVHFRLYTLMSKRDRIEKMVSQSTTNLVVGLVVLALSIMLCMITGLATVFGAPPQEAYAGLGCCGSVAIIGMLLGGATSVLNWRKISKAQEDMETVTNEMEHVQLEMLSKSQS
jgi:hypothetical protein